ncbi:MAG TPA: hypothetical protein PLE88_10085 [Anaerohalosphaeraceae bacterium]|nr:hypothetical protein [Anaerohalosphaeraceae bacterium]
MGRKSNYKPDYVKLAYNACSRNGADIAALANLFGVHVDTIYDWMHKQPDFKEAICSGRDLFDTEKVERKLVELALGYEYEDIVAEKDEKTGRVRVKKYKKQLPPNPAAIIFYLKNRQPGRWKDKIDNQVSSDLKIVVDLPDDLKPD